METIERVIALETFSNDDCVLLIDLVMREVEVHQLALTQSLSKCDRCVRALRLARANRVLPQI